MSVSMSKDCALTYTGIDSYKCLAPQVKYKEKNIGYLPSPLVLLSLYKNSNFLIEFAV